MWKPTKRPSSRSRNVPKEHENLKWARRFKPNGDIMQNLLMQSPVQLFDTSWQLPAEYSTIPDSERPNRHRPVAKAVKDARKGQYHRLDLKKLPPPGQFQQHPKAPSAPAGDFRNFQPVVYTSKGCQPWLVSAKRFTVSGRTGDPEARSKTS